ncbi:MAG: Flp pilus assembly protein CpaB [Planctomycetota bacterium]
MRSIRPQTVTLAVLAILFGLGAAWAAKQILLAKQPPPEPVAEAPPPPMATLLVVQSNLVADARIREQDVGQVADSLEKLNKKNVPLDKVFKSKQQAVGRILKKSKPAGSWLTEEDFYELGKGPQLKLKEGHRAITLRVDDPAISSSIIRTGCLVDVILTTENPDDSTKLTRRLVSGVEVLSPPVSDGGVPNSVTSVSGKSYLVLSATPEQANRLALAQQMAGTISVTLCAVPDSSDGSRMDSKTVDALLSHGDYQLGERDLLNLPPHPAPPPPPERTIVEQIRGNKIDYVIFTEDNVRLSQEEARQNSLPTGTASAAAPASGKKCKTCGKGNGKGKGGESTPSPTPAPRGFRDTPPPEPPRAI